MKLNYACLPCIVNQVVKVADMTGAFDREQLFKKVFSRLAELSFTETNSEIAGMTFGLLKEHIGKSDPYKEVREYYNKMFMDLGYDFERDIEQAERPFEQAVKYAIVGNIIDFNPVHSIREADIMSRFGEVQAVSLTVSHLDKLRADIGKAKRLLYIGDNCGEIVLDKLLVKQIKALNPGIELYFAVRGEPVVNDSVEADAYFVGMDEYAVIINNGDSSLGTVLHRTSGEFRQIYQSSDVIIAKGQANYESLSDETDVNIYFMLVAKCAVIARYIGVAEQSYICMNKTKEQTGGHYDNANTI